MFKRWKLGSELEISSTVLTVMQKDQINYLAGWGVEIFVISIKVREDYSNLHLAQLFSCSVSTIANIVTALILIVIHSIY